VADPLHFGQVKIKEAKMPKSVAYGPISFKYTVQTIMSQDGHACCASHCRVSCLTLQNTDLMRFSDTITASTMLSLITFLSLSWITNSAAVPSPLLTQWCSIMFFRYTAPVTVPLAKINIQYTDNDFEVCMKSLSTATKNVSGLILHSQPPLNCSHLWTQ